MSARLCLILFALLFAVALLFARNAAPSNLAVETASPEMQKLAKAFVGDWDTTEAMERSEYFPNGGGRKGLSHWRLGVGGTTLIGEGHSNGSAGPLDHLIVISWDSHAKVYSYFVCFKDTGSGCFVRGTAHWEGDEFVNDYEEIEHGKATKWRDSFIQITPTSHVLIAARQQDDGSMKTLITSRSVRR